MTTIPLAFAMEVTILPIAQLLPSCRLPDQLESLAKFKQVRSSIAEIGLIEPLSVTKEIEKTGAHTLLDGHVRVAALRSLGIAHAPCLIASDDERLTYNYRVNRLTTIQEHHMIRRAIDRGVPPERLAKALNVDVTHLRKKINLLDGLCPEIIDLLKDREFSPEIARFLRMMKPMRQIECVELMVSANNMAISYVEAMFRATKPDMLVEGANPRPLKAATKDQIEKMQREMGSLQARYKAVEHSYGQDILNLVLARGYLIRLLGNSAIVRYLKQRQPDVLKEFDAIVKAVPAAPG